MATYTGIADISGNFTIPFSANYTSGQKIIITAEKDAAVKTIELFAPSDVIGGGVIQFSGTFVNFPQNIGVITLTDQIGGVIEANAMRANTNADNLFFVAAGLVVQGAVTSIKDYAFSDWYKASQLTLPASLTAVGQYSFQRFGNTATAEFDITLPDSLVTLSKYSFYYAGMKNFDVGSSLRAIPDQCFSYTNKLEAFNYRGVTIIGESAFYSSSLKYNFIPDSVLTLSTGCFQYAKSVEISIGNGITNIPAFSFYQNTFCLKFTLGLNVSNIASNGLGGLSACNELICLRQNPPTITENALTGLKSTCIIKVPSAALTAYQAATHWSIHVSKMIGV